MKHRNAKEIVEFSKPKFREKVMNFYGRNFSDIDDYHKSFFFPLKGNIPCVYILYWFPRHLQSYVDLTLRKTVYEKWSFSYKIHLMDKNSLNKTDVWISKSMGKVQIKSLMNRSGICEAEESTVVEHSPWSHTAWVPAPPSALRLWANDSISMFLSFSS